jgi:hypothetical protein
MIAKLEKDMREASKMLEFEYAAILRDRIILLRGEKEAPEDKGPPPPPPPASRRPRSRAKPNI